MPHDYDQSAQTWDTGREDWQTIRNSRPIPPRHTQVDYRAAVTVRIDWERDGVEHIDTHTIAYAGDAVLVQLHDRRLARVVGAWVGSGDVRRRLGLEREG